MLHRKFWTFASAIVFAAAACGGGSGSDEVAPVAAAAPAAAPVDPATVGSVMGTITLEGTAPAPEQIQMTSDPNCLTEATNTQTEYYVVGDGGALANVFVYVKERLKGWTFPPATGTMTLDQDGCRWHPHVFGLRVGQTLEILNSDPTLHNVHVMPSANAEFNVAQPFEGMRFERTFSTPEIMVSFKCDVHGWMHAYMGVLDHPYFAVTGQDGGFDISGLPPGDYTIEAWHERLGTQTQNATIGEGETAELNFTFAVS
jgi:plastocyanin